MFVVEEWFEIVVIKLKLLLLFVLIEEISFKLFNKQISLFKRVVVVKGMSALIWLACM